MTQSPIEFDEQPGFPESKNAFLRLNPKFAAMVRDSGLEPYLDTPAAFEASVQHFYHQLGKATGLCPMPLDNARATLFSAIMERHGGIDGIVEEDDKTAHKTAHDVTEAFDNAIAASLDGQLRYGARAR